MKKKLTDVIVLIGALCAFVVVLGGATLMEVVTALVHDDGLFIPSVDEWHSTLVTEKFFGDAALGLEKS